MLARFFAMPRRPVDEAGVRFLAVPAFAPDFFPPVLVDVRLVFLAVLGISNLLAAMLMSVQTHTSPRCWTGSLSVGATRALAAVAAFCRD